MEDRMDRTFDSNALATGTPGTSVVHGLEPGLAPGRQAFELLYWGYVAAPVVAGLDKFLNLLTDWDRYLAPQITRLSPFGRRGTMKVVGVVEVAAGALVAVEPRVGGYVVAGWLGGIIVNLALRGGYWDIALRDLGLSIGAIALGRLGTIFARRRVRASRPVDFTRPQAQRAPTPPEMRS
jgi:hypothetical protein